MASFSLSELRVDLLPELSYPTLTVRTEFEGAAPAEVEKLITEPIEEVLGVVKNVRTVKSVSRPEQSDVTLAFTWGTDMDAAGLEVREKLDVLTLPLQVQKPILLRFNPATDPVLRLSLTNTEEVSDPSLNLKRLRRFGDEQLRRSLETVDGVAAVRISGGFEEEIQVHVDPLKLARQNIDINQVITRLREENVNLSGGTLKNGGQRFLVRTVNEFESLGDMGSLIIQRGGLGGTEPVYLRDLADIVDGAKEREAIIRLNDEEAIEVAIYKEGDANTVAVAQAMHSRLQRLRDNNEFPLGYEVNVIADQSVFIEQSISEVVSAAMIGGVLAVLVLYIFLGQAWTTLIISVAMPVSVVASFFLMDRAGVSLNIMSLGGIALAVGLLVDNAIVVLENIVRLKDQGKPLAQAAVVGTQEVATAVVASTLTSISVFVPLVFVDGIAGQLFRDQALTVTFSLLFSLLGGSVPIADAGCSF